ncbi:hypothetical protein [Fodinicola acaciae]|uniref:hypothetical protein n=1 Tax=Fodinicola acaciae TaxID=2681555 RepID=UPI0013CF4B01|nr:hypothetical protein [Fodinicola acaciae]
MPTVRDSILTLDLGRTFDCVLLASTLVNTPDDVARQAMLEVARRHTGRRGSVVIQWHPPEWFDNLRPSTSTRDRLSISIEVLERQAETVRAKVHYGLDQHRWTQTFTARRLSVDDLSAALCRSRFGAIRWLTADKTWLAASTEA